MSERIQKRNKQSNTPKIYRVGMAVYLYQTMVWQDNSIRQKLERVRRLKSG